MMSAMVAGDGAECCAEGFAMICSLGDLITLQVFDHTGSACACVAFSAGCAGTALVGAAATSSAVPGMQGSRLGASLVNRFCKPDAAGQAETGETHTAGADVRA
jgi:hypothetical protein